MTPLKTVLDEKQATMLPFHTLSEEQLNQALEQVRIDDVKQTLSKSKLDEQDLIHLLAPVAEQELEAMAQKAFRQTRERFGKIMKLYAPLYVSNVCSNRCSYCGFNVNHTINRRTLTLDEVEEQAGFLAKQGFQNILLVSGESRKDVPPEYLEKCIKRLKPLFPEVSIEVYPLETEEYHLLFQAGLYGLVLYQETYLRERYKEVHLGGNKRDFDYRIQAPARGAQAGLRQVGLGTLLGLSDFRMDAFYLGNHARYLQKTFWRSSFGLSFPRITRAEGDFEPDHLVTDKNFVQMVTALRLYLPDAPFSLSTRESQALRRHLLPLGFTQMSAGSCTEPGGYGQAESGGKQFEVEDTRAVSEIAEELMQCGLEPVWKDWDHSFDPKENV